jgi:hypothetical protein
METVEGSSAANGKRNKSPLFPFAATIQLFVSERICRYVVGHEAKFRNFLADFVRGDFFWLVAHGDRHIILVVVHQLDAFDIIEVSFHLAAAGFTYFAMITVDLRFDDNGFSLSKKLARGKNQEKSDEEFHALLIGVLQR